MPALRAAIAQVFAHFWVVTDPYRPGKYGILPEPRLEMINGAVPTPNDARLTNHRERLRRVPVALDPVPDCETGSGVPE